MSLEDLQGLIFHPNGRPVGVEFHSPLDVVSKGFFRFEQNLIGAKLRNDPNDGFDRLVRTRVGQFYVVAFH